MEKARRQRWRRALMEPASSGSGAFIDMADAKGA
jgi:hypothetical protein